MGSPPVIRTTGFLETTIAFAPRATIAVPDAVRQPVSHISRER
jgi:hypothetical protein